MDHRTAQDAGPAPRPRLLAATGPLLLTPVDWVMDAVAEAGYSAVEVMLAQNPATRDPERIARYAQQSGLEVPIVHGPYLLVLRTVLGVNYIEKTLRSLELTAAMGATVMVAHAPFRWERGAREWLANEVEGVAEEHGVTFAMENLFPVGGRTWSSVVTLEELTAFPHIVFDTSHFAVSGIDLFEAWDALRDRTLHLHVSDNFGNGKDSHAPLGAGVLPLRRFLAHVGASGWGGTITLELDCRAYLDSRESLVAFLSREREKAEEMLAADPADVTDEEQPATA